jgi:hypothetical protein
VEFFPSIKIENTGLKNGRFINGKGQVWTVARLVEHSKGLPVFDLPLAGIDIGVSVFGTTMSKKSARELAEHVTRVNDADLDHPVLMDPDGFIMDGWHRIVKALCLGKQTVKAVRFIELPSYEFTEPD